MKKRAVILTGILDSVLLSAAVAGYIPQQAIHYRNQTCTYQTVLRMKRKTEDADTDNDA